MINFDPFSAANQFSGVDFNPLEQSSPDEDKSQSPLKRINKKKTINTLKKMKKENI